MKELLKLVAENPDLPIVAMVDGEIVGDPSMMWLGSITRVLISDIGLIGERYYDDREDFKEAYYNKHDEELDQRFNYKPCIGTWGVFTDEVIKANDEAGEMLEAFLNAKADEYMRKAIVIYVREPDSEIFKEAE
jgi:hypothetical protein